MIELFDYSKNKLMNIIFEMYLYLYFLLVGKVKGFS